MSNDTMRCALCGSVWVGSHACSVGIPGEPIRLKGICEHQRADLERRTRELLERLLRGEHSFETTAECIEKFEDDARALLAEWEARR